MNTTEMRFDEIDLIAVPITIGGEAFVLREATAEAAGKYHDAIIKSTRMADGKITGSDGLGGVEPLLVSLCLFRKVGKEEQAVPLTEVKRWPTRVVKPLFDRVKEISELDAKDDRDPKADPAASIA
jgi:hypothetical protein